MPWQEERSPTAEKLLGVCCCPEGDYAVGTNGTLLFCDASGDWRHLQSGTRENLHAIAGRGDQLVVVGGNLHVGGNSLLLHRMGDAWHSEPSGMQHILLDVCATPEDWVACGYNGATIRGTPGSWHREDIVHYTHNFAVCATDNWLFVAGLGGTVLIYDGHRWRTDALPIQTHIRGLAATSPERVVAVGLGGAILRFDGSTWRPKKSPTQQHLEAVWLGESGRGWASGYGGTLLAYDGKEWTQTPSCTTANLYAVHGTETHALAVGAAGTVCRWTVP